ncbi:hypothetical protein [Nonomuraea endophytica]|uniref:hypothetical protein n=1 Tax=Nonomuraea endophytica TaxID=714136 RepID=UPI0037CBABFE
MPTILPPTSHTEQRLARLRDLDHRLDTQFDLLAAQPGCEPQPITSGHAKVVKLVRELADVIGGHRGNTLWETVSEGLAQDEQIKRELRRHQDPDCRRDWAVLLRDSALRTCEHARAVLDAAAMEIRAANGDALQEVVSRAAALLQPYAQTPATTIPSLGPEAPLRLQQKATIDVLGRLLDLCLPECWNWELRDGNELGGQLDVEEPDIDTARLRLHQWAAALANPVWEILHDAQGVSQIVVIGSYQDRDVAIWAVVSTTALGETTAAELADLSAPPEIENGPATMSTQAVGA